MSEIPRTKGFIRGLSGIQTGTSLELQSNKIISNCETVFVRDMLVE